MHPATIQHICGMIAVVRQALNSIEAAVSAEMNLASKTAGKPAVYNEPEESRFLDETSDDVLGRIIGLQMGEEDEKDAK